MIQNLPEKYKSIWEKSEPLLEKGRIGDTKHAAEVAEFILNYKGDLKLDLDIFVPLAIMHDIGHFTILPEHWTYVTGEKKLTNGKLVHMLTGAKVAKEILESVNYDKEKTTEIVDIISVHDADQIKGIELSDFYNSENKKIFHDIDCLDRFTEERLKGFIKMGMSAEYIKKVLLETIEKMAYDEFRKVAQEKMDSLDIDSMAS